MAELPLYQPLPELAISGYDDDGFLDPPTESLYCPVCLLVLREPNLMSCCGAHICQVCIERIQANEQSCPCCRSEKYINVLNKNERGKVLELKVCCLNSVKGCEWVGELGDQQRHFTKKCQYIEEVCHYGCGGYYPRFLLHTHEQDECPERPVEMKMATFTKQMLEKVNSFEKKYQVEIIKLNTKLKDQEERHKMELQIKSDEDKKEMYQLMTIQQERHELQNREMKKMMKEYQQELHKLQKIVETNKHESLMQQAEILQLKEEMSHLIAAGCKEDVSNESKPPIDRKVVQEGFLTRRENIFSSDFVKEFISLEAEGKLLRAYNDDTLKAIKQEIVLHECISVRTRTKGDDFVLWPTDVETERCFVVITNNPHYFIADTEENAIEWIHKISKAKTKFSSHKIFQPKNKWDKGLRMKIKAPRNAGLDLKKAVSLPDDEQMNDWLAVHVVDFFNRINLIYGTVCEFCTEVTCPIMSGGPKFEYFWADEVQKKPMKLPATQYISRLMDWIEKQINDDTVFPSQVGVPFPRNFLQVCKKILTRLYRVFVHVYIHHFEKLVSKGEDAETGIFTCYKHFYFFVIEFKLVDPKEFEPLVCHYVDYLVPQTAMPYRRKKLWNSYCRA